MTQGLPADFKAEILTEFLIFDRITAATLGVLLLSCKIAIPKFKKDLMRVYMQTKYTAALRRAGAQAVWVNGDDPDAAVEQMLQCDGLLLSGGEDVDPAFYGQAVSEKCGEIARYRDETEMKMLKAFFATGKPILGICRGNQLLNVYFGGTLHQDILDIATCCHNSFRHKNHGNHLVTLRSGTRLAEILGREQVTVNSLHHQAVDTPAPNMVVAAVCEDGITEAVEIPDHRFCIGVQWHPEHMSAYSKQHQGLFDAFVAACKE